MAKASPRGSLRRGGALRIAGAAHGPGSRDPRSVHFWTDVAVFSRFYRYARWVLTTPTGSCEMEVLGWPRRDFALGPFFTLVS